MATGSDFAAKRYGAYNAKVKEVVAERKTAEAKRTAAKARAPQRRAS